MMKNLLRDIKDIIIIIGGFTILYILVKLFPTFFLILLIILLFNASI
jgi:hypothetical protein